MNQIISTPTSSSRASGSGPSTYPTTPKGTGNTRRTPNGRARKAQSSSPQSLFAFASSSMCSSPSARNVPLPPIEWLNQLQVPVDETSPSRPSSTISNTSSSSSLVSSSSPSSSTPSSPVSLFEKTTDKLVDEGIRVCPLQLIAAVASA